MDMDKDLSFYAACIPKNARQSYQPFVPESFISTKKDDVMKILKCHRGARFKMFRCYPDALKFVLEDICDIINPPDGGGDDGNGSKKIETGNQSNNAWNPEEPPLFPSVDVRDLNVFKRAIMDRDLHLIRTFVWSNPRYLISLNFDSPTIIVQGARYNAVHLAIRNKAPEILDYLLETVNSIPFIERMYSANSSIESLREKQQHLLDLYLNSPDKANFDTPLHMACKLAQLKCIEVLMGYVPVLDTQKRNKQGLLPGEVVQESSLRAQIREMLDSSVFIMVERSLEDLTKSIKWCAEPMGKKLLELQLLSEQEEQKQQQQRRKCASGSGSQVSALVGPLTPEKSRVVYDALKSPKRLTPEQRITRMADPGRGLERVVFELSSTLNVSYREYWPFLGVYAAFSTEQELRLLDEYLERRHDETALMNRLAGLTIDRAGGHDETFFNARETLDDNADDDDDDNDGDIYYSAPGTPLDARTRFVTERHFYINGGTRPEKVDRDVYEMVTAAIEHDRTLRWSSGQYCFLDWWYRNIQSYIQRQNQSKPPLLLELTNGGD